MSQSNRGRAFLLRFITIASVVALIAVLVGLWYQLRSKGNSAPSQVVSYPDTDIFDLDSAVINSSRSFSFFFTEGGLLSVWRVELDGDGRCKVRDIRTGQYTDWPVDAGTLAELRDVLASIDFLNLDACYKLSQHADGTHREFGLEIDGVRKHVRCSNNYIPEKLQTVCDFLFDRIITPATSRPDQAN
jgi:hypothetical protein